MGIFNYMLRGIPIGGAAGGATVLLQDSFNRSNRNLVGDSPDIGNAYNGYTGLSSCAISSNKAVHANDTAEFAAIVYSNCGESDCIATGVVNRATAAGFPGLCGRVSTSNGWIAFLQAGDIVVRSFSGTTFTNRGSTATTILANTDYTLRLTTSGTSIKGEVLSGASVQATVDVTSALYQTNGGWGVYHSDFAALTPTVDDLLVVAN